MGVIEARRRILLNTPHIATPASAGLVNFSTDMIAPLKECKVHFAPVQSGTGDPSPTNVRPISGWNWVDVTRNGINQWDEEWEVGTIDFNTGEIANANNRIRTKNFNPCSPNTTYYGIDPTSNNNIEIFFYDKNKVYIRNSGWTGNATFISPNNACYFKFIMGAAYGTTYNNDISINYPPTDTSYHPYTGTTTPISWESEAGTIYGGYVDLVKGEVVAEWAGYTITGNEIFSETSTGQKILFTPNINSIGGIKPATNYIVCDAISTFAEAKTYVSLNVAGSTDGFGFGMNGYIIVGSNQYANWGSLAGEKIVFKLATPITYALTQQIIKSLKGANNMWSTGNGDTTITYWTH